MEARGITRWLAAGVLALGGCAAPPPTEVDLASLARWGELRGERRTVSLETADSWQLGTGWSWPERLANGQGFRWAVGESSDLRFYCAEPRDLRLVVFLRAFAAGGVDDQGLRCRVNGRDLGRRSFRRWSEVEIAIPADAVVAGENLVELQWDRATRPADVGPSGDQRPLAAAVGSVVIDGLLGSVRDHDAGPVRPLTIPPASELRLAASAGEAAWIEVSPSPAGSTLLEIWSRQDGEGFQRRGAGGELDGPVGLGNREGPVEIAFRASRDGAVHLEGVVLKWSTAAPLPAAPPPPSAGHPDVVLYVVDTLRADRLGCYGGPAGLTPAADALAAGGVLFERATAQSSWTKPSMISVLSGLLTTEHGIRSREPVIPAAVTSLAERFAAAGYRTGAFTTNAYLTRQAGFDRGFETFEFAHVDAHMITRRAVEWLESGDDGRPVLLWVHTVDPHAPYEPREPFRGRWAPGVGPEVGSFEHVRALGGQPPEVTAPVVPQYRALYDAEVAQNDDAFSELLEHLRKGGRYDGACIAFVSDHGEELWEHGVNGHGWDLFEEVLQVPLILKPPRCREGGRRVERPVQHVDLAPTLLRLAGLEPLGGEAARDLFEPAPTPRVVFAEMSYEGREGFAVRADRFKLIEPRSRGFLPQRALYDLATDPGETVNLANRRPVTAAWLAQEGRRRMALLEHAPRPEREVTLTTEQRRALEALGYLAPGE